MRRLLASAGALALAAGMGGFLVAEEPKAPAGPDRAPTAIEIEGTLSGNRVVFGGGPGGNNPMNRYRDFNEVVRGAEKIDGLFTLHKKDDHLYAEIKPHQFDQPLLLPITIARGLGKTGEPLTSDDEMVLVLHKVGDRVQLIRRNIYFKSAGGAPIEKSVKQNYTDSIIMALPIVAMNPAGGMSTVIDLSDIFLTDFAQLGLGFMDRNRSTYSKVKGFPNNLEIEVEATYGTGRGGFSPRDGVADGRGITIVLHYSLIKAPDPGYRPRAADDRLGHWLTISKEFGGSSPDTNINRVINRWRLEKADPRAKLSPPKKQIVWWIEDTVPHEYRPYVEAGILEWNKAFEKIGFRNAMTVRWQQPGEEFDPEDTNYCTFRWVSSDAGYARTCFRANPLTGEIIDGDVIFDGDGFIRSWKQQYALLVSGQAMAGGDDVDAAEAAGEIISPILAARQGFGSLGAVRTGESSSKSVLIPSEWGAVERKLAQRFNRRSATTCQFMTGLQDDLALAAMVFADNPPPATPAAPGDPAKPENKPKPGDPAKPENKPAKLEVPEDLIAQGIKEVVMHEVGHSIGLRHNYKASTMLTSEQLHDTKITHEKGLIGSVMDYAPINIAPKGTAQGDYFTTTLGPYDYWAIEYAYRAVDGDEAGELKKIAARAPEGELQFATDEDMFENEDPYVNQWDLGNDPCKFARDRIALASELMKSLDAKVVQDGESWERGRRAFAVLIKQWGNGAALATSFIGGQSIHRDHKGDKGARDPIVPVPGDKQRECLTFLSDQILSDKAFQFSPALLRKLAGGHWRDWGSEHSVGRGDYPLVGRILDIQKIVLNHCLAGSTLSRLQNQELQADAGSNPLRMEEVFRSLTDGIWSDLNVPQPAADAKDKQRKLTETTLRRNLQREHVRRLSGLVLGERRQSLSDAFPYVSFGSGSAPADARALARMHLKQISDRIGQTLEQKDLMVDDTTRAHLDECRGRIAKVLDASLTASE